MRMLLRRKERGIFLKKSLTTLITYVSKHLNEIFGGVMKTKKADDSFLGGLDQRRETKQIQSGTIWLKSYEEYKQLAEAFEGKIVKPIHAGKMLGVSRAMVLQLEREGKIRAFRLEFTDEVWNGIPLHLKPLITRSDTYIWIPIEDVEAYAKNKGRKLKDVKGYYINGFFG